MGRWRTYLLLVGLALATPLVSGCLTTAIARAVIHKLHRSDEQKSTDDGSRPRKHESKQQRPEPPAERQEAPEQPASSR
jgi:hypothetical protein